jgi:hypothetical protein
MARNGKEKPTSIFTMRDAQRLRRLLVAETPQKRQERLDMPVPDSMHFLHEILPQNVWKGRRCWIVAGGPSLKDVDVSILKGELVIGINRAYEICDPTVNLCMDQRLWGWIVGGELGDAARDKFEAYRGIKLWALFDPDKNLIPPDEGYFLRSRKDVALSGDLAEGINWGCHGGYAALSLAIALGADPIYLLGYDMNPMPETEKKVWWHDGYPDGQTPKVYPLYARDFETHKGKIAGTKREIVNLNPTSGLPTFRKTTIAAEGIKKIRRPLVVSFHTHPEYKVIAGRMEKSVRRFGFEVEVSAVESRGSWLKNAQYKAKFILDKLVEKKRDIVWLDADSVVNSYPTLFDNFPGDIGVHICDWKRHTEGRRDQKELLGAVMYCRYNKATISLLRAWVKAVELEPMRWEQLTLYYTLKDAPEGKKVKLVELPAKYCTIFDTMADVENPVIEQFQASRFLRGVVG